MEMCLSCSRERNEIHVPSYRSTLSRFHLFICTLACALTLTACDTGEAEGEAASVYRTPLVDGAANAVELPGGGLLVAGFTDGRIGYGDYTLAYPLLLRATPGGRADVLAVYRDVVYGEAVAAVPSGDGFAVLVQSAEERPQGRGPRTLTLYQVGVDGQRQNVLFQSANTYAPRQPLLATADGGFVLTVWEASTYPVLNVVYRLDASGVVLWRYVMPGVQFVSDVSLASDGGLFILGTALDSGFPRLARVSATGQEVWQQEVGDGPLQGGYAVVSSGDGAAVLGDVSESTPGGKSVLITRISGAGDVGSERTYATGRLAPPRAFAALPDGGLTFAYSLLSEERRSTPPSTVVRVAPDGTQVWARPFGEAEDATYVATLVPSRDGRIAAVGTTGKAFSGYGGDDTDIRVVWYRAE